MKESVSHRWITLGALSTAIALACAMLGPDGLPWAVLAGFSLLAALMIDGRPRPAAVIAPQTRRIGAQG